MSDYLVHELERYGVVVRDRSDIAALHGEDGRLAAVTLKSGELLSYSFMFLFLGAVPCTEWLDDTVGRDRDGFILTGAAANTETCSRPTFPACSRPVTCAPGRPNAVPPPSVKEQWPSSSSTPTSLYPCPRGSDVSIAVCIDLDQIALREPPACV